MKYLSRELKIYPQEIKRDMVEEHTTEPEICLIGDFDLGFIEELKAKDVTIFQISSNFKTEEEFKTILERKKLIHRGFKLDFTVKELNEDETLFTKDKIKYIFKGTSSISPTRLKLICSTETEGRHHVDKIDLCSYRSKKNYCADLNEVLGVNAHKCEKDLLNIYKYFERKLRNSTSLENDKPIILTNEEIAKAKHTLKKKNLASFFTNLLTDLNYIGEDKNKLLTFLIALSRKLPSPISGSIRSASSAGKTYLLDCIASITPDEDIVYASRLSAGSLFYMPKDYLSHKLLVIDEAKGASEATEYSIRTLQSRKKLTLAVVKRDASGKQKTTMFDVLGPISFLDSSTSFDTNPENLNRCFIINLDESPEQTLRIFDAIKLKRLGATKPDLAEQIKLAKNMQRVLRPLPIIIPFVTDLNFPSHYLESRRKFDMLLSLTETICFLNQYQRNIVQTKQGEVLEASIEDYKLAYDLTIDIFNATFTDLDQFSQTLLDEIVTKVITLTTEPDEFQFTRKDILDWTNRREHELKRLLPNLERLDYLIKRSAGRGGKYTYSINFKQIKHPNLGITKPESLFSRDLVTTK